MSGQDWRNALLIVALSRSGQSHAIEGVLTALFGVAWHFECPSIYSFPTVTNGINSKKLSFCQCGNRALQQEARPHGKHHSRASLSLGGLIADGGCIHRPPNQHAMGMGVPGTQFHKTRSPVGAVQRKGENPMKVLISTFAMAIALAITGPAFAGDVSKAKTEAECQARRHVGAETNTCSEKKM